MVGAIIVSILQIRKQGTKKLKWLSQGYTASEGQDLDQTSTL